MSETGETPTSRGDEPNQKRIDADAAQRLLASMCWIHGVPFKKYADGVLACPRCEAEKTMAGRSPHEKTGEDE